jgi:hypothetical protein
MNKLTVYVHTPSGVGEAALDRDAILNSRWLTAEQKSNLLGKFPGQTKVYGGDTYIKIAEAKRVEITESELYFNPSKNKYLEVENKYKGAYVNDIYQYEQKSVTEYTVSLW